jgi:hypothetical protein
MTRLGIILFGLLGSLSRITAAEAEDLVQPGQWKVTSNTTVNGAFSPPQSKLRCISPEQAADVAKTFGPVSGTVNSTCEDPVVQVGGRSLQWRLQCRGQLDMDVAAQFEFDTPQHYKATIVSKGRMAGALISDVTSALEGERVGECGQ